MRFLPCFTAVYGEQLTISNMYLRGQNDAEGYKMIKMDVRWDNSWRTSTYESNHDAVWILPNTACSGKRGMEPCNHQFHRAHASIRSSGQRSIRWQGAFLYRDADGSGSVNFSDLQLRWNYTADGLNNTDSVEICVFGIEMVYIPQE